MLKVKDQQPGEAKGPVVKLRLCSCKRKVQWFLCIQNIGKTCGNPATERSLLQLSHLWHSWPSNPLCHAFVCPALCFHPGTLLQHLSSFSNIFNISAYNYNLMKLMGLRAEFDAWGCMQQLSFNKLPCPHNYENKNWKRPCCPGNCSSTFFTTLNKCMLFYFISALLCVFMIF